MCFVFTGRPLVTEIPSCALKEKRRVPVQSGKLQLLGEERREISPSAAMFCFLFPEEITKNSLPEITKVIYILKWWKFFRDSITFGVSQDSFSDAARMQENREPILLKTPFLKLLSHQQCILWQPKCLHQGTRLTDSWVHSAPAFAWKRSLQAPSADLKSAMDPALKRSVFDGEEEKKSCLTCDCPLNSLKGNCVCYHWSVALLEMLSEERLWDRLDRPLGYFYQHTRTGRLFFLCIVCVCITTNVLHIT